MTREARSRAVVVDTSVALSWVLPDEPWHRQALAFARDIAAVPFDPIAAPNLRFELRHGLLKAIRRGRLGWDEFAPRLDLIERMTIRAPDVGYPDDLLLDLCQDLSLSWGDAHHVRLALAIRAPLVTADARLVRALDGAGIWVENIADRPLP